MINAALSELCIYHWTIDNGRSFIESPEKIVGVLFSLSFYFFRDNKASAQVNGIVKMTFMHIHVLEIGICIVMQK